MQKSGEACFLNGLSSPAPHTKKEDADWRLLGWSFKINPHPYRMRLDFEGLSHGLKTCHWHVFLTAFRVPPPHTKKEDADWRPLFWCERWDSNPHGETTRTSNVLVYHSNTLASAIVLYAFGAVLSRLFSALQGFYGKCH